MLMDFHCIEVLLDLPEFRVIHQVISPKQLDCISNAETTTSYVPTVGRAAPG